MNISLQGATCHDTKEFNEAKYLASSSGYNWGPFQLVSQETISVQRTLGTLFDPDGWLTRANKKVDISRGYGHWHAQSTCKAVSELTRHIAGKVPELTISRHGWMRWSGVVSQIIFVYHGNRTEHQLLTRVVMDCGGGVSGIHTRTWYDNDWLYSNAKTTEDSWEEPMVGGTTKQDILVPL